MGKLMILNSIALMLVLQNGGQLSAAQAEGNPRLPAAKSVKFTDVYRSENNTPKLVNYRDAEVFCQTQNGHIPSAREFAHYVATNGGRGLVDDIECRAHKDACVSVRVNNDDRNLDSFKYSVAGHSSPNDLLGLFDFWSSSYDPDNQVFTRLAFNGATARIPSDQRESDSRLVICVKNGP